MSRLALHRVACARGDQALFEGVDLDLRDGGAAVVTGANGAGKSSLLRIAASLLSPTAGGITREGGIALLDEHAALDAERTLGEAVDWWAALDGRAGAARAALDDVGLSELANVPVRWLSTGQRKRAGLARVVAAGAAIWLLDEPANGLDTGSVDLLGRLIARHRAGGGIALVATHLALTLPDAHTVRL